MISSHSVDKSTRAKVPMNNISLNRNQANDKECEWERENKELKQQINELKKLMVINEEKRQRVRTELRKQYDELKKQHEEELKKQKEELKKQIEEELKKQKEGLEHNSQTKMEELNNEIKRNREQWTRKEAEWMEEKTAFTSTV
jgi:hypothetical protein